MTRDHIMYQAYHMNSDDDDRVEREIERLSAVLVPYICERTGLSHDQVCKVMEVQETFWESQKTVMGRLFVLGFEIDRQSGDTGDMVG